MTKINKKRKKNEAPRSNLPQINQYENFLKTIIAKANIAVFPFLRNEFKGKKIIFTSVVYAQIAFVNGTKI